MSKNQIKSKEYNTEATIIRILSITFVKQEINIKCKNKEINKQFFMV